MAMDWYLLAVIKRKTEGKKAFVLHHPPLTRCSYRERTASNATDRCLGMGRELGRFIVIEMIVISCRIKCNLLTIRSER